jgi:hypothetical protein
MYDLTFGQNSHFSKKSHVLFMPNDFNQSKHPFVQCGHFSQVEHHKLHGSWFGNNSHAKFVYHRMGLYGIDMYAIHLIVLFEHWYHMHYLNTNVICFFVLFKHRCCMFIHVVHTWRSCTQFPFSNNAWYLCVNDTKPWNNKFHTDLKWTNEAYKFVMNFLENYNLL